MQLDEAVHNNSRSTARRPLSRDLSVLRKAAPGELVTRLVYLVYKGLQSRPTSTIRMPTAPPAQVLKSFDIDAHLESGAGNCRAAKLETECAFTTSINAMKARADPCVVSLIVVLRMVTVLAGLVVAAIEWSHYENGRICSRYVPPESPYYICAGNIWQLATLTITRISAGVVLAALMVVLTSKLQNTKRLVQASFVGSVIDFEPSDMYAMLDSEVDYSAPDCSHRVMHMLASHASVHKLHTEFGIVAAIASVLHSAGWIARIVQYNTTAFLWETQIGRAGIVTVVFMVVSVTPMAFASLRRRWSYEVRKSVHYLSVAMMYEPVGLGTVIRFELPKRYRLSPGQYLMLNIPWISHTQWHPFSVMPETRPNGSRGARRIAKSHNYSSARTTKAFVLRPCSSVRAQLPDSLYVAATGDFTVELFAKSLLKQHRPLWISACNPSTIDYSLKHIAIKQHLQGGATRINNCLSPTTWCTIYVLWATRDRHMIKHFAPLMQQCNCTIWYTNTDGNAIDDFTKLQLELSAGVGADEIDDTINSDNGHVSIGISAASVGVKNADTAACVPLVLDDGRSIHATVVKLKAGRPDFTSEVINIINTQQHISSIISTQVDRQATLAHNTAEATALGINDDIDRRHSYLQQQQLTTVAQPCTQSDTYHVTALTSDIDIDSSSDADHTALGKYEADRWAVLYCGNSDAVAHTLRAVCRENKLSFSFENFGDW
eukprot:5405-Heterococcus_DN1.PRE.1